MKYLTAVVVVGYAFLHLLFGGPIGAQTAITALTTETTFVVTPHDTPFVDPYLSVTTPEARWDTRATDKTAYWPTANSPIASLPESVQATFACLRYVESRNHLTSVSYAGAGGLYQFMPLIWSSFGGLAFAPTPEQATGDQQDQVAVNVYNHNHGFYPEWQDPACGT
jgi:Transglycosylase-like domain